MVEGIKFETNILIAKTEVINFDSRCSASDYIRSEAYAMLESARIFRLKDFTPLIAAIDDSLAFVLKNLKLNSADSQVVR